MALTSEEKAYIHESAREVSKEIIKEVMISHVVACPHGQVISKSKWLIIGLSLGASVAGGSGLAISLLSILK